MTWTQHDIDAWHAHTHRHLHQITTATLDLIDIGPTDDETTTVLAGRATTGRPPSRWEQDATYRANEADYQPSTLELGGGSEFYAGPETRTVAWEGQVQQAVTSVFAALSYAVATCELLRVHPADERGRPLPAPTEPATRLVADGHRAGEPVVDVAPHVARRHLLEACGWLAAAVDVVTDRLRATTGEEVGEHVAVQAQTLGTVVRGLAGRLRVQVPDRPVGVVCEVCGRPAKYVGLERCDTCRRRELRAS